MPLIRLPTVRFAHSAASCGVCGESVTSEIRKVHTNLREFLSVLGNAHKHIYLAHFRHFVTGISEITNWVKVAAKLRGIRHNL